MPCRPVCRRIGPLESPEPDPLPHLPRAIILHRFMKNFVSFWNPGNLSISASTRWRCTVAAPANLIRVSLDGNVIPIATAVITASSAKQVTVEAGTVATMSQLPRPVLS